jgi:phage-related protein
MHRIRRCYTVEIFNYTTSGGKDVIAEYVDGLPVREQAIYYAIREKIYTDGLDALQGINTRQLKGKLWEIKFDDNRIMYVVADSDSVYFLHICKKQKGKTEKRDLDTAIRRAKAENLL